ncbi:2Fe-2S iron-sulfur cluster binding domain-containing protein [Elizabethkingia argentiflava]|uniref:2Fe-2S iron-sulfur cluster binding domain-containing protein n=1 Tax=Elizabethkingia argenteiflava TaxID=2681556 RepID=A0A845PWE7_9FLAO|nr:2Fe-2S iron-sulfur cluster-binding protein [Elizabethkingia argenteiflava]NAW51503.1 2Fe-2S iron-sulfur cluster binding domain-containing protein [Elizabethkingia argenteiflava]
MNLFYKLKAVKIQKEACDAVNVAVEIPTELKDKFRFKQGQYLNFRIMINGNEERRSYSICNAPSEKSDHLEVVVKRLEGGKVSTYFHQHLHQGECLEVMPPMGNFNTIYHPTNTKTYVGLAAGSGLSPVLSNIKEALYQEPHSKAYLFYSNRSMEYILKKKELDQLEVYFKERLKVIYMFSRQRHEDPIFEGRISVEKLEQLFKRYSEIGISDATYFICGPSDMIKLVSNYLKNEKKVPAIQVLSEYFLPPDAENTETMSEAFKAIANVESMVTLIIDDDEYSFHLNSKKESILDKALQEKLPVPFACKGGVCCTCKAQIMEGEVFMEKNFALTEEEVQRGYVLTCQCHPTTNVLMLNYDI